jgi:DNA methylase.
LDPFAGSFATAIVVKRRDRVGAGYEINEKLFRQAIFRNI